MRILYLLNLFAFGLFSGVVHGDWHYGHEDTWGGLCQNGQEQSPIALSRKLAEEVEFPPFIFGGYQGIHDAAIKNNGHAVEVRLQSGPSVKGGGFRDLYVLDNIHFHWDSEHTVNNKRYPLEVHFVHYAYSLRSVTEALKHREGVAVLAVLFYHSPDDDENDAFINALERIRMKDQVTKTQIRIDQYLPRDKAGFYRYNGSLTTPNCTEGLIWTVFTHPLPISKNQMKRFYQLQTDERENLQHNDRPLQKLNNRKIFIKSSPIYDDSGSNQIWYTKFLYVVSLCLVVTSFY